MIVVVSATEQISISKPFSLATNLALTVMAAAMLAYAAWHAILTPDKIIVRGLGSVPPWAGWLIYRSACSSDSFVFDHCS